MKLEKQAVMKKILKYCKKYKIKKPNFNDYDSVKNVCDEINNHCPFCGRYRGHPCVICICETKNFRL